MGPTVDPLRLDNQLCFALYAATNAITRSYRATLGQLGLTYPQYLVIAALQERPSLTSGELARALRLDAGTLTPMLKRLESAGLIERTRRPGDERVVENRLTPAGAGLRSGLLNARDDVMCRTKMSGDDMAALRDTLQMLTETLNLSAADLVEEPA